MIVCYWGNRKIPQRHKNPFYVYILREKSSNRTAAKPSMKTYPETLPFGVGAAVLSKLVTFS